MAGFEIADRHGVAVELRVIEEPQCGAAIAAKIEVRERAAPARMLVELRVAFGANLIGGEARLCGKGAATPRLAIATVADRDADRFAGAGDTELSAAAGGVAGGDVVYMLVHEGSASNSSG